MAEVRLVAQGAGRGVWAGLEVFRTPDLQGLGYSASPSQLQPKLITFEGTPSEMGQWCSDGSGWVLQLVAPPPPCYDEDLVQVQKEDEEEEQGDDDEQEEEKEKEDGECLTEQAVHKVKKKGRRRPKGRQEPSMFTIECWSLGGPETDLERLDRVMDVFAERLMEAGVVL